jgi:glyoxylate utilization-related uncharacterized protein
MPVVHHRRIPEHWAVLCGQNPPDDFGFKTDRLQIIYNCASEPWTDEEAHAHGESDEVYIVLEGAMSIQISGRTVSVQAGELLCVPAGTVHQLVDVKTPVRSLVIRSPSVNDKLFATAEG